MNDDLVARGKAIAQSGRFAPKSGPLDKLHDRFSYWFGEHYDLDAIDAVLAAAVERLDGDPLWLLLVSGPGATKTETVMPLRGCGAIVVSTISSDAALLSGTPRKDQAKDATGGLLRRVSDRGVLVVKDMTSILSLHPNMRAQIMAALREIYDGCWSREIGADGGRVLKWEGRVAVVGAVTTAWDRAHAAVAQMGDRFMLCRIDSGEYRWVGGRRAMGNTGDETGMRDELAALAGEVIGEVDPRRAVRVDADSDDADRLLAAADLVTLARTACEFDYRGDVIDAHAPEFPTRFAKQLVQIVRGGQAVGLDREHAVRLAIRCARDSLPPLRLAILDDLAANPCSTTNDVRKRIDRPRNTVDRQLQALHMLRVLTVEEVNRADGPGSWWYYSLAEGIDPTCLAVPEITAETVSDSEDKALTVISGTGADPEDRAMMPSPVASPGTCPVCVGALCGNDLPDGEVQRVALVTHHVEKVLKRKPMTPEDIPDRLLPAHRPYVPAALDVLANARRLEPHRPTGGIKLLPPPRIRKPIPPPQDGLFDEPPRVSKGQP